jgi:hypothetical protein
MIDELIDEELSARLNGHVMRTEFSDFAIIIIP